MTEEDLQEEKVSKRFPKQARIVDLRKLIRELGIWNLPTTRALGARYKVSHTTIIKNLNEIVETLDPRELNFVFTEFFEADKKLQSEIRKAYIQGTLTDKLKAGQLMMQLQQAITDLLEKYGKKPKVPDLVEILKSSGKFQENVEAYETILKKLNEKDRQKLRSALFDSRSEDA